LNELPQEIKFSLVFDEESDREQMNVALNKGAKSIAEEEIESD
jgi:acetylornithine deacetylase/succinyl-diaminopimelate desuccinylase-like protein